MQTVRYVHWKGEKLYVGYLQDYPDYMTQGETEEELKENLLDIYRDIASGLVENARRVDDLVVGS